MINCSLTEISGKLTARFLSVDAITILTEQAKSPALLHRAWQLSGSQGQHLLLIIEWILAQTKLHTQSNPDDDENLKFLGPSTLCFSQFPQVWLLQAWLLKSRPTLAG